MVSPSSDGNPVESVYFADEPGIYDIPFGGKRTEFMNHIFIADEYAADAVVVDWG